MRSINIRQIAKAAGVSTATVSRVINGTAVVKAETREKVMRIVESEGFHPNLLGQRLRNSQSGMLLVLVSSLGNPFCAKVICGIEHEAERLGFNILLCNSLSNPEREAEYLKLLQGKVVDGVITMNTVGGSDKLKQQIGNKPWVQCGEYEQGIAPYVSIDNYAAAKEAVEHLIGIGRSKIGMISASKNYKCSRERERGYRDSLNQAGLVFEHVVIADDVTLLAEGALAFEKLITAYPQCDAIFVTSDILACGALNAALKAGKSIPEDIAIVGFDGQPYAEVTTPTLTTVQQPMYEIGVRSAQLLIQQITGQGNDGDTDGVILPFTLISREST